MSKRTDDATVCHALILPAPLHNPKTACGHEMSSAGLAAGLAGEHEVLGVRGPDERITCAICRVMIGARNPSPAYTWDPERVPTIQELNVEHGISVNMPVENAQVIVAGYLDMLRASKAENFLIWTWGVSFGDDEKYAEMRANHPNTEWDQVEVVTFVRKKSKHTPESLAAARLVEVESMRRERDEARAEVERLRAELNTPELHDFAAGVVREAAHQRARWGSEHDAGKAPADWFWLLGYLGGKALAAALAGNTEKALHHCISSAAALANWHAALSGQHTGMRPGIAEPEPPLPTAPEAP